MIRIFAVASLLISVPASATIFWSNFDVGTEVNRTTGGAWPRVEREPLEAYDNGSSRVGVGFPIFYDTYFDFTVDNSFVADRAIMALSFRSSFDGQGQRIGFTVSERNDLTNVFTPLGALQVQANSLRTTVYEIDSPFGTNGTSEERLFQYLPIQFTAGRTYRIRGAHATGTSGLTNWLLSDTVAPTGTAFSIARGTSTTALAFQPTLALTDGGSLLPPPPPPPPPMGTVPEPESWALMILGFGLVGASLRRRRAHVLA